MTLFPLEIQRRSGQFPGVHPLLRQTRVTGAYEPWFAVSYVSDRRPMALPLSTMPPAL